MTKRTIFLLIALCLAAPLMFFGCAGDDGATGATGPPGSGGGPGTGVVALETCAACHGAGQPFDVNNMHRLNPTTGNPVPAGTALVTVNSVTFGAPVGDNVPVSVTFTFAATNKAGANITSLIDLTTQGTGTSAGTLAYLRFTLAKMVPGLNGDANEWNVFVHKPGTTGSGPFTENRLTGGGAIVGDNVTGVYTYTFPDNSVRVSDGYVDNVVVRTIVEARSLPLNLFVSDPSDLIYYNPTARRPVDADELDTFIPDGGGTGVPLVLGDGLPRKNDVSTAACNACHDPLAIHGGSRRDYKYCATCHNAKLETLSTLESNGTLVPNDNLNLVNLIHKIHNDQTPGAQNIGFNDFSEVTYPQDIRNCTRCHQGPDADNTYANWMNKPTITGCGSCHINVNFATGAGHVGGAQATNGFCALCHPASAIPGYHATENVTPNNPQLPGTLVNFTYGINSVTVAADNTTATINFFIQQDNVYLNLGDNGAVIAAPAGFSGSPSFLFAYAMAQDGIAAPVDYNNLGRTAGQPASLAVVGRTIVAKAADNSEFTIVAPDAFPNINPKSGAVGAATMRAVALQGYFTQTNGADTDGDGVLDNVGRHTFSVVRPVAGDAVRRVAVESGYTNNNNPFTGVPVGCLECHEIFEGHGGNRVSNAQVCVMCHNPNLSTSGRTITANPINPAITALFGTDPLQYPEVSQNFKELIHGLHGADKRTTNFVVIRNRSNGILLQGDEITFPGDLSHCGKCHLNNLYQNVQTTGRLNSTVVTTTGVAGETVAQINAARASVPNATDLVNTPATSACGHCHDSDVARSHFVAMGGEIRAPRSTAVLVPPPLYPDVLATP